MRRNRLLLAEITAAAERIVELTADVESGQLVSDRDRRDALMWNFTVLGEAVGQLSDTVKSDRPDVPWGDAAADGVPDADQRLAELLVLARARGDAPAEVFALDALAREAAGAGDTETATCLLAAADERMRDASHFVSERDRIDADMARGVCRALVVR